MNAALLVGINAYDDEALAPLSFAEQDAHTFRETLIANCAVPADAATVLSGVSAERRLTPTRSNIIRELNRLADSCDRLVFFFSGHGFHSTHDGHDYLVPSDAVLADLEGTSIRLDVVIRYIAYARVDTAFLYLDACRGALERSKSAASLPALTLEDVAGRGIAIFSSCSPDQKSYEAPALRSSIFTYALRQALSSDGKCKTVYELDRYLRRRVPSLCEAYDKPRQDPFTRTEPITIAEALVVAPERAIEWSANIEIGSELRKPTPSLPPAGDKWQHSVYAGIDFGTSYSCIGKVNEAGVVHLAPGPDGRVLVPSAVAFVDDRLNYVVGWPALDFAAREPENVIITPKRHLGTQAFFSVRGRAIAPELAVSLILRSLRSNFEEAFGVSITDVLASVPANFNITQSAALAKAFELASLKLYRFIGEPCASAVLLPIPAETTMAAIVDLGGGTLDVSVVECDLHETRGGLDESVNERAVLYEILGVAGDNALGGVDFDTALAQWCRTSFSVQGISVPEASGPQLQAECERAKIDLGYRDATSLMISSESAQGVSFHEMAVSRADFRELTRGLVDRIKMCLERALHNAERLAADIDVILLAGQGCKIFVVREAIAAILPGVPLFDQFQETAVIQGLCSYSGVLSGVCRDRLILDSNYTEIGIRCVREVDLERDLGPITKCVSISRNVAENTTVYTLVPTGSTVPHFKYLAVVPSDVESGTLSIELIERSTMGDHDEVIGIVSVEVVDAGHPIELLLDCDANRTMVLIVGDQRNRQVRRYQVNNLFLHAGVTEIFRLPSATGFVATDVVPIGRD